MHVREGPCFLRHWCTCTPRMTSSASRLARYGVLECAFMMWSAPSSLACCSILLYVVAKDVGGYGGVLIIFRILSCMSAILVVCMVLSGFVVRVCGHVRNPPMGGSAAVKMISGVF